MVFSRGHRPEQRYQAAKDRRNAGPHSHGCGATTLSISETVKLIKGGSSKWVKETIPGMKGFAWQDGYGAFTVSRSNLSEVICYIEKQREHHRGRTFQEEYRAFLDRHEVEYDERYLWE